MFIRFDRMYKHDGHTDRHCMTKQAMHAQHRAAKISDVTNANCYTPNTILSTK